MNVLVGYTGFVGSNLHMMGKFDKAYNSKNIELAYGLKPDLLVYAGIRAEKYLANHFPEKDMEQILQAQNIIKAICPKKLVLVSTIDVLDRPLNANEDTVIVSSRLQPYGYHRYRLEEWAKSYYPDALIVRLPALFGKNIKKNFIYDFLNVIPFILRADKFMELSGKNVGLKKYYRDLGNGFYQCRTLSENEKEDAQSIFKEIGFTALNFTDSRSIFQFYPLSNLWRDMQTALENHLHLWHPATEPVSAAEIYRYLTGGNFMNELEGTPVHYDYRTKYAEIFGGKNGYIYDKNTVLKQILQFVNAEQRHKK